MGGVSGRIKNSAHQEFRLSKELNSVLGKICDLERVFIRLCMDVTHGGSLLCVAQKG